MAAETDEIAITITKHEALEKRHKAKKYCYRLMSRGIQRFLNTEPRVTNKDGQRAFYPASIDDWLLDR